MNGIFAIDKPGGITSNQFMMKLQHALTSSQIFSKEIQRATAERMREYQQQTGKKASKRKLRKVSKVKMGHGGTLDPLASGVLVIGIGSGTKKLANYLSGTVKEYEAEALFGVSTTSGDVEGEILSRNSVAHLNTEDIKSVEEKFKGCLKQTPPIFAALKMNGKPLYEYAREGKPLPRAIEPRQVTIYDLKLFPDTLSKNHKYPILRPESGEVKDDIKLLNSGLLDDTLYFSKEYCESRGMESEVAQIERPLPITEQETGQIEKFGNEYRAPLLHFTAKVSSGTYIRSLISDIGKAVRSSSYMVKLTRSQQQDWSLNRRNVFKLEDFIQRDEKVWSKVLELVLEKGAEIDVVDELAKAEKEFASEKQKTEKINQVNDDHNESDLSTETLAVETHPNEANTKKRTIDEIE